MTISDKPPPKPDAKWLFLGQHSFLKVSQHPPMCLFSNGKQTIRRLQSRWWWWWWLSRKILMVDRTAGPHFAACFLHPEWTSWHDLYLQHLLTSLASSSSVGVVLEWNPQWATWSFGVCLQLLEMTMLCLMLSKWAVSWLPLLDISMPWPWTGKQQSCGPQLSYAFSGCEWSCPLSEQPWPTEWCGSSTSFSLWGGWACEWHPWLSRESRLLLFLQVTEPENLKFNKLVFL